MRRTYCTKCKSYKELKKPKISNICHKTLLLSTCIRCENEQIIKEKESIGIIKNLGLINNIEEYQKMYDHVCRRYKSRKIRLKNIDETRNYLIEEIIQNELISQNY